MAATPGPTEGKTRGPACRVVCRPCAAAGVAEQQASRIAAKPQKQTGLLRNIPDSPFAKSLLDQLVFPSSRLKSSPDLMSI
jgi:hypothetical protein